MAISNAISNTNKPLVGIKMHENIVRPRVCAHTVYGWLDIGKVQRQKKKSSANNNNAQCSCLCIMRSPLHCRHLNTKQLLEVRIWHCDPYKRLILDVWSILQALTVLKYSFWYARLLMSLNVVIRSNSATFSIFYAIFFAWKCLQFIFSPFIAGFRIIQLVWICNGY